MSRYETLKIERKEVIAQLELLEAKVSEIDSEIDAIEEEERPESSWARQYQAGSGGLFN